MFGYVTVNKPELKIRDFETYHAYYCGLCRTLHTRYGRSGQLTLSYDMTFLALLLTALYEPADARRYTERCVIHPARRHEAVVNRYTEYAADMTILLSYFNLQDNWADDRDVKSRALALKLKGDVKKLAVRYPRQWKALLQYMKGLKKAEADRDRNLDAASGMTGDMLAEIFVCDETDVWAPVIRQLAFYLGKFIYLMDANDDLEKDRKSGSYNPWLLQEPQYDEAARKNILNMIMAESAMALEHLPIVEHIDILRNVIYSGVWTKYELAKAAAAAKAEKENGAAKEDAHV